MIAKFFRLISSIALPRIVVVGLDIQDHHLFCVGALRKGEEVTIVATGIYEFSEEAVAQGELRQPEALREAIQKFLEKIPEKSWHRRRDAVFVLSLPPRHLYTEAALFPSMSDVELEQAVKLKVETSLPWPREEAYVDWHAIDVNDPEQSGIVVAAISKPILDKYFKVFFDQNWRIGACEFHLFSLARFVQHEQVKSFIFVLIDEDGIEFSVYAFDSILVHHLHTVAPGEDVERVLEDKVKQLTNYAESNYGVKVDRIFIFDALSVGSAPKTLQTITGIQTQPFTPSPQLDARLSVAYGAALRPYSAASSLINLMPSSLGGRYQENLFMRTLRFWVAILVEVSGVFIVAFLAVLLFFTGLDTTITQQNAALAEALAQKEAQAQPLIDEAQAFNTLAHTVANAESRRSHFGDVAVALAEALRQNKLKIIKMYLVNTAQIAISFTAPTRDDALSFKTQLEKAKSVATVDIPVQQLGAAENLRIDAIINF